MKVYVVSRGENQEGSTIVGVFKHKKKAIKAAMAEEPHGGPWIVDPVDPLIWWSKSDYVEILRYKVE